MIFNNPREINIKPLNVGMIWLNFRNSNNFFKLSVVKPTIINGITCPSPKKNRNIIDIIGFFFDAKWLQSFCGRFDFDLEMN